MDISTGELGDNAVYNPLPTGNYTRLIELAPAKEQHEPLRCHLRLIDISHPECTYEALSYAWGAPDFTETLRIGNVTRFITKNLFDALVRFRSADKIRRLWADAVCINQDDAVEKSTQIPLMSSIYRSANKIVVWLGPVDDLAGSLSPLNRLSLLASKLMPHQDSQPEHRIMGWLLLQEIHQLPWFSRRWIIQEVVLNPDVVLCHGPSEMSWARLLAIVPALLKAGHETKGITALTGMMDLWRTWALGSAMGEESDLWSLLERFHHFECADGRDRIYALVGLATDTIVRSVSDTRALSYALGEIPVTIDYSLPTTAVYAALARHMIENQRWLIAWFGETGARLQPNKDWPSWLPDWQAPRIRHPLWQRPAQIQVEKVTVEDLPDETCLRIQRICLHQFYAVRTRLDDVTDPTAKDAPRRWGEKKVKGSRIVSRIAIPITWKSRAFPTDASDVSTVSQWVREVVEGACRSLGGLYQLTWEKRVRRMASTMLGNGELVSQPTKELYDLIKKDLPLDLGVPDPTIYDVIKKFSDYLLGPSVAPEHVLTLAEEDIKPFLALLVPILAGRCVFTCRAGSEPWFATFGIGPPHLELGDMVISPCAELRGWGLSSCRSFWRESFVIRGISPDTAAEDEPLALRFIGDSFIYREYNDLRARPQNAPANCGRVADLVFH